MAPCEGNGKERRVESESERAESQQRERSKEKVKEIEETEREAKKDIAVSSLRCFCFHLSCLGKGGFRNTTGP